MTSPVSRATEMALVDAMTRLLAGHPIKTDGRLTVTSLALEAGISRATANRATAVVAAYRKAVAAVKVTGPEPGSTRGILREESRTAHILAQHIQARALHQRQEEQRASRADILPFRRRPHEQ